MKLVFKWAEKTLACDTDEEFCSTAYWYLRRPDDSPPAIVQSGERIETYRLARLKLESCGNKPENPCSLSSRREAYTRAMQNNTCKFQQGGPPGAGPPKRTQKGQYAAWRRCRSYAVHQAKWPLPISHRLIYHTSLRMVFFRLHVPR